MSNSSELTYKVPGMSCAHCRAAITEGVQRVGGVHAVDVDLNAKTVVVQGQNLADDAVRAAIAEAGYEVAS